MRLAWTERLDPRGLRLTNLTACTTLSARLNPPLPHQPMLLPRSIVNRWILPALPLALALSVYAPTLGFELVYDDHDAIEANTAVVDADLVALMTTPFWGPGEADRVATWRPLTSASFAVDRRVGLALANGASPERAIAAALHAGNLAAFLAAIAALWWLLGVLGGNIGVRLAATVLFAVHPLLTEPVAWTVARADLQSACFGLLFLTAWVRGWRLRSAAFLAGALLAKESAIVLPAVALAWTWSTIRIKRDGAMPSLLPPLRRLSELHPSVALESGDGQPLDDDVGALNEAATHGPAVPSASAGGSGAAAVRRWPRPAGMWIPVGVTVVCWLASRVAVLGSLSGAAPTVVENPVVAADWVSRGIAALIVAGLGGQRLLFSGPLSSDYGLAHFPALGAGAEAAFGWLVWGVLAGGMWLARRRSPRMVLALGMIAAPMLLFSHVIVPLPTAFAERLWVLPVAGICSVTAVGFERALQVRLRFVPVLLLGFAVLIALSAVSVRLRLPDWRDDASVYEAMVRDAPLSYRALVNSASVAQDRGEIEVSRGRLKRAQQIHPESPMAWLALARLETAAGEATGARESLDRAQATGGVTDKLLEAYCAFAARFETPPDAMRRCEVAAAARSRRPRPLPHMYLAMALDRGGRDDDATRAMAAALAACGNGPVPFVLQRNAGIFFARQGRWPDAVQWLQAALTVRPGDRQVLEPLGAACNAWAAASATTADIAAKQAADACLAAVNEARRLQ